jgi:c-di-GMP-binding flagellar brake protein YcgR
MGKEERETEPRFGLASFEKRKHPRFSVDLPVEYWQINKSKSRPGRMIDVSEGGLLLHLSEPLEIGQNLGLNLFIDIGPDLDSIEALVQVEVVWKDIYLGKDGDYRIGVRFVDISAEDLDKLKNFLNTPMNLKTPSS